MTLLVAWVPMTIWGIKKAQPIFASKISRRPGDSIKEVLAELAVIMPVGDCFLFENGFSMLAAAQSSETQPVQCGAEPQPKQPRKLSLNAKQ